MNFFASDDFLRALAHDFYQAPHFRFTTYTIGGYSIRLAEVDGKGPLIEGPFFDYVKPLPSAVGGEHLRFIPKLVTSTVVLDDRHPEVVVSPTAPQPAPLVTWARFPEWTDYEAFLSVRNKELLRGMRKRRTKLVRERSAPTYIFDDRNPEALELLCTWKRAQYPGGNETLENPRAQAMLRRLFDDGNLTVSTLRVGDRYVAIHAGFLWDNEYLALIPAYDPAFAQYGVGKELLFLLLEDSHRRGDKSFDFLQGAEPYKFEFATHLQIIESLGSPPLAYRVKTTLERMTKDALISVSPALFQRTKGAVLATRRLWHAVAGRNWLGRR